MDAVSVFVWRIRLGLLAFAMTLAVTGGKPPAPLPARMPDPPPPVLRPAAIVATSAGVARPLPVDSPPVFTTISARAKPAQRAIVKSAPAPVRCAARAGDTRQVAGPGRKAITAAKARECTSFAIAGGANLGKARSVRSAKAATPVVRVKTAARGANATSAKAGHKLARKADARPGGRATAMATPSPAG